MFAIYVFVLIDVLFLLRPGVFVGFSDLFSDPYREDLKEYANSAVNLVPFKTIRNYWYMVRQYGIGGGNRIWWRNLVGNLVLFLPMGCLLPLLFPVFHTFFRTVLFTLFLVLCVEGVQLLTFTGSCDIDDVILNMAGCVAGYVVCALLFSRKKQT